MLPTIIIIKVYLLKFEVYHTGDCSVGTTNSEAIMFTEFFIYERDRTEVGGTQDINEMYTWGQIEVGCAQKVGAVRSGVRSKCGANNIFGHEEPVMVYASSLKDAKHQQ